MDIRNWALDRIMQLPDHVFGRRWSVMFSDNLLGSGTLYYVSEMALPDMCVLWEVSLWCSPISTGVLPPNVDMLLALGDEMPGTDAEMNGFERLFPGTDEVVNGIKVVRPIMHLCRLRRPVAAQGRRVVLRVTLGTVYPAMFSIGLVFSSIPTEIPEWLLRRTGHQGEKW